MSKPAATAPKPLSVEAVLPRIRNLNGDLVLLDLDLCALFGIGPLEVDQAVSRYPDRFPNDFRFRLTKAEFRNLVSQGTDPGPEFDEQPQHLAFTMGGVGMLVGVLRQRRAAQERLVPILRAFTKLRDVNLAAGIEESRQLH